MNNDKEIAVRLLNSSDFQWYMGKVSRLIDSQAASTDAFQARGETLESQYSGGVRRGLELALTLPETVLRNNSTIEAFKDLMKQILTFRLNGGEKNANTTRN